MLGTRKHPLQGVKWPSSGLGACLRLPANSHLLNQPAGLMWTRDLPTLEAGLQASGGTCQPLV